MEEGAGDGICIWIHRKPSALYKIQYGSAQAYAGHTPIIRGIIMHTDIEIKTASAIHVHGACPMSVRKLSMHNYVL